MIDRMPPVRTMPALIAERAQQYGAKVGYRFLTDGEEESQRLTFAELDLQARAVAAQLQAHAVKGDRAVIMVADDALFARAFMGCQHAGVIAVPAAAPAQLGRGQLGRLRAIVRDCRPAVIVTGEAAVRAALRRYLPELTSLTWVNVDQVNRMDADRFRPVRTSGYDVCLVQYPSGSMASPKGVVVTHHSLLRNQAFMARSFQTTSAEVAVSWLPLCYHLGLVGGLIQTLYAAAELMLFPPLAFVQRPVRWLRAISRCRATASGGPSFAYDLCVRRIPPEERSTLDLSSWRLAFTDGEPIRAATLDAFTDAFAGCGFDRRAWYPCFGLAESTLLATGARRGRGASRLGVDPAALGAGRIVAGDHPLVSSGEVRPPRRVEIVDERTGRPAAPGAIGEIWLAGPDLTGGYWGDRFNSKQMFAARLAETGEGSFVRTGDLGFIHDGELYVTGRRADLVVIDGRHHYPQDIEATVTTVDPAIPPGGCAAFSVEKAGRERLVVVAEVGRRYAGAGLHPLDRAVRAAVSAQHGVAIDILLLVPPRSIRRTASGRVQRNACLVAFARGELTPLAGAPLAARSARGGRELGRDHRTLHTPPHGRTPCLPDPPCSPASSPAC